MKKVYRRLTKEQLRNKVVMSSQFVYPDGTTEPEKLVYSTERNYREKMDNLKNDKFFDNAGYSHNLIRY